MESHSESHNSMVLLFHTLVWNDHDRSPHEACTKWCGIIDIHLLTTSSIPTWLAQYSQPMMGIHNGILHPGRWFRIHAVFNSLCVPSLLFWSSSLSWKWHIICIDRKRIKLLYKNSKNTISVSLKFSAK